MATDFSKAKHTVILSDIHLADAEPPHRYNPYWKRFKRPKYFVDKHFKSFLEYIAQRFNEPIELIFNGDIFDFDSVMALPQNPQIHVNPLEKLRGLSAEEAKSQFKIRVILNDHIIWVTALREFILNGHRVIFVIGNHDIELHWPAVQKELIDALQLPLDKRDQVRFCEWFYISNNDTLVEHGNQYDAYCLCQNPINPLIRKGLKSYVRLPFGNLAGRFMLNGMGLMNPHVDSSFIKASLFEYFVWYFKYVVRTQPFLVFTWLWGAIVTLIYSVGEGLLPSMTDPLTIGNRIEEIAVKSNSETKKVLALRELHVHPAHFSPLRILQELWLDRAIILALIVFASFQFFTVLNVFTQVSIWWFIGPCVLLTPVLVFYSKSIKSEVAKVQVSTFQHAPMAARITKVKRVVHGHTHHEIHTWNEDVEYLNTGTWSPAFEDVECTKPFGRKCFAIISESEPGKRTAQLYEWKEAGPVLISSERPPEHAPAEGQSA
ncbi:MAG: metallophosphoesterase [Oligoflexia bacterium]|nr:metallophosphoesterase [Oligoflexia bacterium]